MTRKLWHRLFGHGSCAYCPACDHLRLLDYEREAFDIADDCHWQLVNESFVREMLYDAELACPL